MKIRKSSRILGVLLGAFLLAGMVMPLPANANEPARPEISLNQAIALSLTNSEAFRKAELDIDRTSILREYADDQLDYLPAYAQAGYAMVEIPWANLLASDLTWRMSKRTATATADATALATCDKYWDVLKAEKKAEVARLGLTGANQRLSIAMVSKTLGMISPFTLQQAGLHSVEASTTMAKAENDLANAYTVFNQAVGLNYWDRPVLIDNEIVFNPMKVDNLQTEISRVKETSPSLWLARENVTMQSYLKDMTLYTGEYRPYKARQIQYEQSEIDAMSAEEMYEALVQNLYYTVLDLEESVKIAQEAVQVAEENLRLTKLKWDLGMAIKVEVTEAEKSLNQAQATYDEIVLQHDYMKLAFQKPWAFLSQQP